MKIKFTFQILLWGISLITITAPEALARHDQRVLDREISLDLRSVPLAAALSEIEMAADVKFAYSASQLDLDQPVTIEAHRKKLGLILNELLGPIAIMYTVDKDYILLKPVKAGIEKPVLIEKQAEVRHPFQAISGTVTDARTLQPIAGVNIVVKGTTSGTTTDSEGKYVIDAEEGDMLVFSFIGYKKIEVSVGGRVVIDVSLEEDVASLKEVVVNAGYYTVTDKAKTGNIVKVTSKEIERQPVTSPLMALQGRMPGVDITPVNGVPGSAVKIEIRGNNSLRFNGSNPLYVVDGVPLNSAPIYSAGMTSGNIDPLSTINPANIESIEVLKDGVATALYGSRGANGVVLITTKTGPDNTGETGLEISLYRGFGEMQNRVNLLNTEQYLAMRHEAIANDGAVPGLFDFDLNHWDTTRYTNWQDELLGGSAEIFDAQATLTGGSDRTSFRLGGSMHHENTIYPGDFGFKSYTANLSISHISADKRLNVSATVNYGANDNKLFSDTDFVNYAMTLSPVAPALLNDEDGQLNWEIVPLFGGSFLLNSWINPLSLLRRTHQLSSANLVANGVINYTLLPGLTFKTNLGFTEFNGSENVKSPIASFSPTITGITGRSIFGTNRRSTWILEPQATFSKNFGDHSIDAIIGSTFQQSNYLYQSIAGQGYTTDVLLNSIQGAATQTYSADDETEYKYQAIFARVGYDWKDKFFVDLIGRRDGSSRFGPGRQFGNFGAVGAGWIFTNEPFMKNVKAILSFGKLRGSLGVTGNDQIGDYQFYDTYSISIQKYQGQVNLYPTSLYNPDFRWEATHKREAAIELGFLNERISTE
ncbi:MAG: SusC/RagA family TonB-linked outer membrane protein, partial [Chryseosolibacter sp.]